MSNTVKVQSRTDFQGLQIDLQDYIEELLEKKKSFMAAKTDSKLIALRLSLIIANNTEC